jgi:hypothetical protein
MIHLQSPYVAMGRRTVQKESGGLRPPHSIFDAAVDDAGADDVAGGAIVEPDGGGNEAWGAWQQEPDAERSFAGSAGYALGRTLTLLVLDQRDRSVLQGRMMLGGVMRCRYVILGIAAS